MTRHNCDRCGKEIPALDPAKEQSVGLVKWGVSSYHIGPKVDLFELCSSCKEWMINEATHYKRRNDK